MGASRTEGSITISRLQPDMKRYCDFALVDQGDVRLYEHFDGRSMASEWRAVAITPADQNDTEAELADNALLGVVPVFSARAADALLDLLRPNGELLPLRYARAEYMAYNVTNVVDALDEGQSSITRFVSGGGVQSIQRYVFRPEQVRDLAVFKIPQLPRGFVFVGDVFVNRVKRARLTGFSFRSLWSLVGAA